MKDIEILKEFLSYPVESSEGVFKRFSRLPGAIVRGTRPERFVYIRGKRKNKVLLVAHADTVWDDPDCHDDQMRPRVWDMDDMLSVQTGEKGGLGADDRAGCALLWLLRESGHSLLLTDGEEKGRLGAKWLMEENSDLADEINRNHQFMVEFDRGNENDFKCYGVGTPDFREYIENTLQCREPDRTSYTDIVTLCRDITGVNLSLGYYNWHRTDETIVPAQWKAALDKYRQWLCREDLPKFDLVSPLHPVRPCLPAPAKVLVLEDNMDIRDWAAQEPYLAISIRDPGGESHKKRSFGKLRAWQVMEFDDVEGPTPSLLPRNESQARSAADMIREMHAVELVVCQSQGGPGRAAGMAAAIARWRNGDEAADWFFTCGRYQPNRLVHDLVFRELSQWKI